LQGLGLVPLFVVAIRRPQFGPFRLLNIGWVRWIGVLSYCLYLVHHVVLGVTHDVFATAPVLGGIVALVVSVGIAALINVTIERPCARLRRRLGHAIIRRRAPAAVAQQAGLS
jgi:peptidoglycan/LPS O-acetylase OafA/YrhL